MVVFINRKLESFIQLFKKKAVSNLDEESRWTVHYKASWHHQENVFLPSSRSPCVEDLHQQAKVNLKTVLRDCDKLRKDGFRSSQYYSQSPIFTSPSSHHSASCLDEEEDQEQVSTVSSAKEEKLHYSRRSKTPVPGDLSEIDVQTNWTKALPLPTPEERMRQQAQAVQSDVVPINVTGESFDRQAGTRRSLVRSDTALRRTTRIKRRKTITGLPDTVQKELGSGQTPARGHSVILAGHYSTISRLESSKATRGRLVTRDSSCQTEEVKVVPPSVRRIRAQKGQGIAAQLSQSSADMSSAGSARDGAVRARTEQPRFHSLPRPGARISLQELGEARGALGRSEERFPDPEVTAKQDLTDSRLRARSPSTRRNPGDELGATMCPAQLSARATLSSKAEVVAIPTSRGQPGPPPSPGAPRDDPGSSSGNWSAGSSGSGRLSPTSDTPLTPSRCDSAVSLAPPGSGAEPPLSQGQLEARSEGRPRGAAAPPSPCSPSAAGWSPPTSPSEVRGQRCAVSLPEYSDRSLGRSISLRKTKKPPLPPARTDSLRRRPKGGRPVLSESLIASLQRSLEVNLRAQEGGPEPHGEGREPWATALHSQSSSGGDGSTNSSGRSTAASNAYTTSAATPSQSETSSLRSEYSDPWAYYPEGQQPGAWECGPPGPGASVEPKGPGHAVTSPSSGYSSQCNTPTTLNPAPAFPHRPLPGAAKPKSKPKVPERKSSLLSKRRVLGRKDSEDELSKSMPHSPPVTPTGTASSPGTVKQVGSIQRNLRKSSTSSDSFKALLLKKGSRVETGSRMSAAEMLRSTDPRHRPPESPTTTDTARMNGWGPAESRSPGHRARNPREEWASHEGPVPRGSGHAGVRHGRSRTPPSAPSSRYGARHLHLHRLHSSPMTVIREGEVESPEVTEGHRPGDEGRRHSEGDLLSTNGLADAQCSQESRDDHISSHTGQGGPASQNLLDSLKRRAADILPAQSVLAEEGANQDWDS
ncbi:hypothetical protein chiPu_0011437 [Chiloscyllium punctatum]|uniref:NHS-like protein 1 n=1 Tax=Chiloscyllium punctatum TaxID=137246 RepID=A0A401SRJ7_CHIPU|nr:hypothetical protein [Chiloscyllium punctatum]